MGFDGRSRQPLITTEQWKFEQEPPARRQVDRHTEQQEDGQEREHSPRRPEKEPRRIRQRGTETTTLRDGWGSCRRDRRRGQRAGNVQRCRPTDLAGYWRQERRLLAQAVDPV